MRWYTYWVLYCYYDRAAVHHRICHQMRHKGLLINMHTTVTHIPNTNTERRSFFRFVSGSPARDISFQLPPPVEPHTLRSVRVVLRLRRYSVAKCHPQTRIVRVSHVTSVSLISSVSRPPPRTTQFSEKSPRVDVTFKLINGLTFRVT